jgi:hypothetical protein
MIADDDDLVTYVGRLEEMIDEMSDHDLDDELDLDDDDDDDDEEDGDDAGELGSIDDTDPGQLADEIEQFLRDQNRDS